MMITELIGEKIGMTHIFGKDGNVFAVTVINTKPNIVVQKKTKEKDGVSSIQLGFKTIPMRKANKALAGHFKIAGVEAVREMRDVRVDNLDEYKLGQEIANDIFKEGDYVDVTGVSKGKGFAGVMKRHNFKGVPATHGVSIMHRRGGSVGCRTHPGKVMKGKRMAGHMGCENVTLQKLIVYRSDADKGLLLIKGAIPGATGGIVKVRKTTKRVKEKVTK
ncbi:50S ribosomal protein L3 [Candidatus Poribacteria bacterium]|nr:50S ribosomal protein L3 [Candidatus Poribacteria bacterium]